MLSKPLFKFRLNGSNYDYAISNGLPTEYEVYKAEGLIHKLRVVWKTKKGKYQSAIYKTKTVNKHINNYQWIKF